MPVADGLPRNAGFPTNGVFMTQQATPYSFTERKRIRKSFGKRGAS